MDLLSKIMNEYKMYYYIASGLIIVSIDWITYIHYKSLLNRPFRRIRIRSNSFIYSETDILRKKYEALPIESLNLIKNALQNQDFSKSTIINIIDVFYKLVISVAVACFTLIMTAMVATLAFLSENEKEYFDKPVWIENINKTFGTFSSGMESVLALLFLGAIAFLLAANHLVIIKSKKHHRKIHLNAIKAAKKNIKKTKDFSSAIQYPVQSSFSGHRHYVYRFGQRKDQN